ncbi:unnamed protein product [Blepharisma stoltei]|uniref:CENP-V/GFA domain-containing protein n=1 Tax=Blepharisma stoltei TaxID=1481888 RepID=A0AAU9JY89_9CILI|nr:unnamed protein product [Blepharisma stoltei]
MVVYTGSCHCHAVTFEVEAPSDLVVWRCDCSICVMKQNHHFIVPEAAMHILTGEDVLTEYRFNTNVARHLFCKICGVESFYRPRSNPDGYGINIYCIDKTPSTSIIWQTFEGSNWEEFYKTADIQKYSRVNDSNTL